MFRLIKYALIFFLGYKIIKMLFGSKPEPKQPFSEPKPPQNHKNNFSEKEGEYIDYEEIK